MTPLLLLACSEPAAPLPAEAQAVAADAAMAAAEPPLAQVLYDASSVPALHHKQQRVRLIIWLHTMQFGEAQLDALLALHRRIGEEQARAVAAQEKVAAEGQPAAEAVYDALWERLAAGADPGDPALAELARPLAEQRLASSVEEGVLAARQQALQNALESAQALASTLTPAQESALAGAAFVLRGHADPAAERGAFTELFGPVFSPGQWNTLTRGAWGGQRAALDLVGLWSTDPEAGRNLSPAQRAAILLLVASDAAIEEAVSAWRARPAPPATAPG